MEENKDRVLEETEAQNLTENPSEIDNINQTEPTHTEEAPAKRKSLLFRPKYIIGFIAFAIVLVAVAIIMVMALREGYSEPTDENQENVDDTPIVDETPDVPDEEVIRYSQGFEYKLSADGSYYILTGLGECKDLDLNIPPEYQGKPVRAIGPSAFGQRDKLTSVVIPDSITEIGTGAFIGCFELRSLTLPDSITHIGGDAFFGCFKLKKTNQGNLIYLGTASNPFFYLIDANNGKNLEIDPMTKIVCAGAFADCISLAEITIPDGVVAINEGAFGGCINLKKVTMANGVKSVGEGAFYDCKALEEITLSASLKGISSMAFNGCESLVYNEFDNGLYLGTDVNPYFVCLSAKDADITDCTVHTDTKIIADEAFSKCLSLSSISLSKRLAHIGDNAFYRCTSLSDIYFDGSVEEFEKIHLGDNNSCFEDATVHYPEN